jgi:hypothetical protein
MHINIQQHMWLSQIYSAVILKLFISLFILLSAIVQISSRDVWICPRSQQLLV